MVGGQERESDDTNSLTVALFIMAAGSALRGGRGFES